MKVWIQSDIDWIDLSVLLGVWYAELEQVDVEQEGYSSPGEKEEELTNLVEDEVEHKQYEPDSLVRLVADSIDHLPEEEWGVEVD